jgi:hypothetical protein
MQNTEIPKVDYATAVGRLDGIIMSFEIGLLNRKEFLDRWKKIKADVDEQADVVKKFFDKEANE